MGNADTLKKYKELLDHNIITQEEFERKKQEILALGAPDAETEKTVSKQTPFPIFKHKISKKMMRTIVIIIAILAVLAVGISVVTAVIEKNQQQARAAALEKEIKPIMHKYSLSSYKVEYVDGSYEVYANNFELFLTKGEALKLLKELDNTSADDPCGDGKIYFGSKYKRRTYVHPSFNLDYAYYRVTSSDSWVAGSVGTSLTPGLYCNKNGVECIYATSN